MEFDVNVAACNWKTGEPNYGVLVWTTDENQEWYKSISTAENIVMVNLKVISFITAMAM